jgi:hypothetical protein
MNEKKDRKRLFEIFSKVNKISLKEQEEDELGDLKNQIIDDINSYFRYEDGSEIFNEGIPTDLLVRIQYNDIRFNMLDENGFEQKNIAAKELTYNANYKGDLSEISNELTNTIVKLTIPVILKINEDYTNNLIKFSTNIQTDIENIDITFE